MEIGGKQFALKVHVRIRDEKKASSLLRKVANGLMEYFGDEDADDAGLDELDKTWKEAAHLIFEDAKDIPPIDEVGSVRLFEVTQDFFGRASAQKK